MSNIRIKTGELAVGQAMPWPVYDNEGKLLLRQGYVVRSPKQLNSLLNRGLYRQRKDSAPPSTAPAALADTTTPFDALAELAQRLGRCFDAVLAQDSDVGQRVSRLAADIRTLCDQDADAALGAVHCCRRHDYAVCNPLHQALLCEVVGRRLGYDVDRRGSLIAAALTANLSLRALQTELQHQGSGLTDAQQHSLRAHPEQSAALLQACGVADPLWLQIVLQHHERTDGSGYPRGLLGDRIAAEAKLLAVADRYTAMVYSRKHREAMTAKQALRELFLQRGERLDEQLCVVFIKELGVFPPGAVVRLINGETAVVIRRGQSDAMQPIVSSFASPRGGAYARPLRRDCRQQEYAIQASTTLPSTQPLNLNMIWGFR